jgi:hypothetical protein|tara:strand:+ start:412 stop:1038 length:627 start_codon:yes stop_codon:yes gene_type:complete
MSGILKVGGSELVNDNGGSGALQWGSGVPSGSIVQVQYTQYTGQAQMTGINNAVEVVITDATPSTGNEILKVDITPRITNSKFLIEAQWQGELNDWTQQHDSIFFFFRGTTNYGGTALKQSGTSGGIQVPWISYHGNSDNDSTPNGLWLRYFDAPNISSGTLTRYKLGYRHTNGNSNQYVNTNRCEGSVSASSYESGISSISVTEIAP